ncbi:MAG: haloacid dehalogenase-like hydrolase [Verrucomicrobiota bacterium]|nr:haloacid dehalogenase-like hydrolase [Verrucomicrobiota bacterium]
MSTIEIAGRTDSAIARQILRRCAQQASPENLARLLDGYVHWLDKLLPQTQGRLLPGIVPLLDALHARPDVVLALLTGNLQRGAELKLTHYGVWHYFEFGAYADDHHDRNELGHFARSRARERHGIEFPPEKIYVLGDTPHDIACARAIGANAVAIATGSFNREQLASYGPDFLFDDLSDATAVLTALS